MRNKFSHGRLSYFLTPRIHGNVIAWVKSSSPWETEWEKTEPMIKDILRWADDGGRTLDQRNRMARSNAEAARKQVNETNDEPQRQRKLGRIVPGNNASPSHGS
jgi:hypothetical protein